jgi:hypothetical protein
MCQQSKCWQTSLKHSHFQFSLEFGIVGFASRFQHLRVAHRVSIAIDFSCISYACVTTKTEWCHLTEKVNSQSTENLSRPYKHGLSYPLTKWVINQHPIKRTTLMIFVSSKMHNTSRETWLLLWWWTPRPKGDDSASVGRTGRFDI